MRGDNIIGQRFGRLEVIAEIPKELRPEKTKKRGNHWLCRCDCGNTVIHYTGALRQGDINSCGCLQKERISETFSKDEIGNKYGKLTVIEKSNKHTHHNYWVCECECGSIVEVNGTYLRNGHTKSCGCIRSWGETEIAEHLTAKNINFIKEYSFNDLKRKNLLRFDFAIFNKDNVLLCLIEYQGKQHYIKTDKFYKEEIAESDVLKQQYCKLHNIPLYEIKYNENTIEKLEQILNNYCEDIVAKV